MDDNPENNDTIISDEVVSKKINTVIIGGFSSRCANCNGNAFPDEGSHKTQVYGKEIFVENTLTGEEEIRPAAPEVAGCGTPWYYMTSGYLGEDIQKICEDKWPKYLWINY